MTDTDITKESLAAPEPLEFLVPYTALPERLDKVIARLIPEHSRSRLQGWIEAGHVLVNGQPGRVKQMANPGDKLVVWEQSLPAALAFTPEDVDFQVVDQSTDWIDVHKPADRTSTRMHSRN